jgi:general stress protein 26
MSSAKSAQDQLTPEQHLSNLRGIIEGARTVMLLSHGVGARIEGRPMALVRTGRDNELYLTTSLDAQKIAEMVRQPDVTLSAHHEGFAIIQGLAQVSQDRALIDELWKESWHAWYPDGKTDPTIAVVTVFPADGMYWDVSMTTGLSYVFRSAKAHAVQRELDGKSHIELGAATSPRGR